MTHFKIYVNWHQKYVGIYVVQVYELQFWP